MTTTGYTDTFGRTVASGLGTATSGQTYTLNAAASQFSVGSNVATIAMNSAGNFYGYIDNLTQDVDITGQVALTAIPATNLATVGFVGKWASSGNYYIGTMMVAAGGAISLRFSKVISGGLVTIATVSTGLTYVANTFYNLRFSARWSQPLQTNILQLKLWAVGATEPGGWTATTTDASLTQYTAGTFVGIIGRDESSVPGSVSAKIKNVASLSYHLPMPASADPMCYDPAVAYPQQTAIESLADAADAAMATLDPLADLAGLFPRVRVSNTNLPMTGISYTVTYNATEFNVGTSTNLGYDPQGIYLPVGIWLITYEHQLTEAATDYLLLNFAADSAGGSVFMDTRSNPNQSNDQGVGGTAHMSKLCIVTNPAVAQKVSVSVSQNNGSAAYTASYAALSAIKISDYFA